MTIPLKPIPYVRDSSETDVDLLTQTEINWVQDGESLYGNNVNSEPNYGTLNKVGTNLQENIIICDENINTVNDALTQLSLIVSDYIDLSNADLLLTVTPPNITNDLIPYISLNEGDPLGSAVGSNLGVFSVNNFDAIIWQKNGDYINLPNVDETDLGAVIDANALAIPSMTGEYQAIVYNETGSTLSTKMFVNIIKNTYYDLPTVTTNITTTSETVKEFSKLELKIIADNYSSLQWKLDGFPITGETTNILKIENISSAQSGTYSCDVTNPNGTISSNLKTIIVSKTINTKPVISSQPNNRSVNENNDTTFIVAGQNYDYIHWEKDGEIIPNLSSGLLQIFNCQLDDEGWYRAKLGNDAGTVYSQYVYLTVIPLSNTLPPIITQQPTPVLHISEGSSGTITVDSNYGTSSLWQKDSNVIATNTKEIIIPDASINDAGSYRYLVFNGNGFAESNDCIVIIDDITT